MTTLYGPDGQPISSDPHAEPLRHKTGDATRERPIFDEGPIAPWHGRVRVVPLELRRGRVFEVLCEWTGPPPPGSPPSQRPVQASIPYIVTDVELALAAAQICAEQLARPRIPDPAAVTARLEARRNGG